MINKRNIIFGILGIVLLLLAGISLSGGLFAINVDDTVQQTPSTEEVRIYGEEGVESITLELASESNTYPKMYGACVPNVGLTGKPAADYCRSLGHKDRGCGWTGEVACSCKGNQQGCHGIQNIPIDTIEVFFGGEKVGELNQENSYKTIPEPLTLGRIANEQCGTIFQENIGKGNNAEECIIPLQFTGGTTTVRIKSSIVGSSFENAFGNPQPAVEIIPENLCENNIQDDGEIGIDCGGSCTTACQEEAIPIEVVDPQTGEETIEVIDLTSVEEDQPVTLSDGRTVYAPSEEILKGDEDPRTGKKSLFSFDRIPLISLIGIALIILGIVLSSFFPRFRILKPIGLAFEFFGLILKGGVF